MIDTHCHIYSEQFEEDLDTVLNRAADCGVEKILMPAIDFDSLARMELLKHQQIEFYKMAGIHPTEIGDSKFPDEEELFDNCSQADIYGVGETGLDYYWSTEHVDRQQASLRLHCKVARSVEKPVILHNRESTTDLLDIIEEEQDGSLEGIWHCFNGTVEEGRRAIDLGLHLGIGGVLTFKNAGVDRAVAELPLDRMVLETDAPYLAPAPNRGKRNEPSFIRFTAQKLSEVQSLSLDETVTITSDNARRLFRL
ncbi:MAG: TatD family hydrolase [Balneolaceae bacterium]|nr:TatD family hydrolase [Balneolaceae bacterium]